MKFNSIKEIHKNKFLNLYEASYTNANNDEKKYELVSRDPELDNDKFQQGTKAEAVGIIMFSKDRERVLVQKEFRLACNEWVINFPGGLIDPGETFIEAAKRELREETGLEILEVKGVMGPAVTAVGLSNEKVYTVVGVAVGEFKPSTSADEEIEPMWLTKEQVKLMLESSVLMSLRTQSVLWMWVNE